MYMVSSMSLPLEPAFVFHLDQGHPCLWSWHTSHDELFCVIFSWWVILCVQPWRFILHMEYMDMYFHLHYSLLKFFPFNSVVSKKWTSPTYIHTLLIRWSNTYTYNSNQETKSNKKCQIVSRPIIKTTQYST